MRDVKNEREKNEEKKKEFDINKKRRKLKSTQNTRTKHSCNIFIVGVFY